MRLRHLIAGVVLASALPAAAAEIRVASLEAGALDAWDTRIASMAAAGELHLTSRRADPLVPGVIHERFGQLHRGVPVWGSALVRQRTASGSVSLFGSLHEGIDVDARPAVSADAARKTLERRSGVAIGRDPELVVLPHSGSFVLAWRLRVATPGDVRMFFVDARTGSIALEYSDQHTQAAVGSGRGVLGDMKKVSTRSFSDGFLADDLLRPPAVRTNDLRGDLFRTLLFLNGVLELGEPDLARDADNAWTDPAAVDAHAHAGWTYDYLFKRFGRRGLDDADMEIRSLVHPVKLEDFFSHLATQPDVVALFYVNAFYFGEGLMVYGEGLPRGVTLDGQRVSPLAGALDVVAHELAHGVTDFSSGLIYLGESGALNEAFSDIVAAGVEFFFQAPGSGLGQADYLVGEDVFVPGGVRSMENPAAFGDPDHYVIRFRGSADNGGVHINAGIPNQAFYLAIEGGTNRSSGIAVRGVGGARRGDVEQAFYRGFAFLLPPTADFAAARAATVQSARDLFGAGSDVARAIDDAWVAVGVP